MTSKHDYHGGVQFDGEAKDALTHFSDIVAATLEDYGYQVERKAQLSETEASIVSSQYLVRLTLDSLPQHADPRYQRMDNAAGLKTLERQKSKQPENRLALTVTPVSAILDDTEVSELMLVVMLYRMIDICSTRRIEWLSEKTVLTAEQFLSAFDSFAPRRLRDKKQIFDVISGPFAGLNMANHEADVVAFAEPTARPIQLTDDQLLSIAFRTEPVDGEGSEQVLVTCAPEEQPSDILRLSSWGMTGAIASVSAPIALSLAAVNLIRGEDFRLNTQVVALTVALFGLNTSGAIAGVTSAIGF
ncbi:MULTISPECIES: hypothetical protein [unclassified Ruegeria]|uniref:hypothetical protein n=1 Tax=unclassified Ruegeria TaxID=2625375 RepID=UPI0020C3A858|nr:MULTISPECIES: hypothetical protein [unclassified Ruegeria]